MKRKTIVYIAMSIDGYIADQTGGVDWLQGHEENIDHTSSYETFLDGIDSIILGYTTYLQIIEELSPNVWPYLGKQCYVFTHHRDVQEDRNVTFISQPLEEFISLLKQREGKAIWICGGASIVQQLQAVDDIDEYQLTIVPIVLGSGIRLFQQSNATQRLYLISSTSDNGFVSLTYKVIKE